MAPPTLRPKPTKETPQKRPIQPAQAASDDKSKGGPRKNPWLEDPLKKTTRQAHLRATKEGDVVPVETHMTTVPEAVPEPAKSKDQAQTQLAEAQTKPTTFNEQAKEDLACMLGAPKMGGGAAGAKAPSVKAPSSGAAHGGTVSGGK